MQIKFRDVVNEANSDLGSIDLVVQSLPPVHDAIGEYTACLAKEFSLRCETRVLTCQGIAYESIEGVSLNPCFDLTGNNRFDGLKKQLIGTTAEATILQYNPFAWGKRGWAPDLVSALKEFKKKRPDVRLGVMFHETYTMSPGGRAWVMRQYQLPQFRRVAEAADVCFFSTEKWGEQEQIRRPTAKIFHAPVGTNLPLSTADRLATRAKLGIASDAFVCGTFGGSHPSRMFPWICQAANRLETIRPGGRKVIFLHVGGEKIDWSDVRIPTVVTGRLGTREAADAIAAMDLMINPFIDGISTRRSSAIAALQQGVPILTTRTDRSDTLWTTLADRAVFLADPLDSASWDHAIDRALAAKYRDAEGVRVAAIRAYEEHFSWPIITDRFAKHLQLGVGGVKQSER